MFGLPRTNYRRVKFDFAQTIKVVVRDQINQGNNEEEIYEFCPKNMVNGLFINLNLII